MFCPQCGAPNEDDAIFCGICGAILDSLSAVAGFEVVLEPAASEVVVERKRPRTRTKQVFISHDSEDAPFAKRLASDLRQLGLRIWIAPDSIEDGEDWVQAINRGLEESSHMVIVMTPAAISSPWVQKEMSVAISLECEGRMELIPLDVKPCAVPALWRSYQWISFRQDYDTALIDKTFKCGIICAWLDDDFN